MEELHGGSYRTTSKMRWKVRLKGNGRGLRDLEESFDNDPKVFEEEGYFLWSSQFQKVEESGEIREIAEDIVRAIRNFGERDSLRVEKLQVDHIIEILDDGSELTHIMAEPTTVKVTTGRARITSPEEDGVVQTFLPADRTYEWTQLALKDEKVSELVDLVDKGYDWVNLYRIYDFIQDNIDSEDNIVSQGWWSESKKNLFKHTANSREAIGDEARHGNSGSGPADPMTLAEAKRLVDTLIDHWLRHRKQVIEGQNLDKPS